LLSGWHSPRPQRPGAFTIMIRSAKRNAMAYRSNRGCGRKRDGRGNDALTRPVSGHASAAANETEARALFTKFVAAQNAHNPGDVKAILWNSPSMLLFARGVETRGPEAVAGSLQGILRGHMAPRTRHVAISRSRDLERRTAYSCPDRFRAGPSRQPATARHVSDQPNVRPRCNRLACRFLPTDRKHPTQFGVSRNHDAVTPRNNALLP
jgi:hypothetical protein